MRHFSEKSKAIVVHPPSAITLETCNMYRSIAPFDVVMQIAQTTLLLKEEVAMWFKNLHGIENSAILLHVFGT